MVRPLLCCNREIVSFGKIKLYCSRSDMVIHVVDIDFLRVLTMHRCRKDAVLFYWWRFSFIIFLSKKRSENLTYLGIAITKRRAHFQALVQAYGCWWFQTSSLFLIGIIEMNLMDATMLEDIRTFHGDTRVTRAPSRVRFWNSVGANRKSMEKLQRVDICFMDKSVLHSPYIWNPDNE